MLNRIKQILSDNNGFVVIIGFILPWFIWATVSIFSLERKQSVVQEDVKNVCDDICEIKNIVQDTRKQVVDNKEEILKLLLSINREVKLHSLTK